jgi:hypothetical protein
MASVGCLRFDRPDHLGRQRRKPTDRTATAYGRFAVAMI